MDTQQRDRNRLTRRFFRKVSGIAGLLRSASRRYCDSPVSDQEQSKSSDFHPVDKAEQQHSRNSSTEEQIPALHVENLSPDADMQPYRQDSLHAEASDWSQSKSARRKQKRRDHTLHLKPASAASAADATVQPAILSTDIFQSANNSLGLAADTTHTETDLVRGAAATALQAKQQGKRPSSRAASPLGKNKNGGSRGRGKGNRRVDLQADLHSQATEEDIEARQIAMQEEAEMQIMARGIVSRARVANSDVCQAERSHGSGTSVGLSPRKIHLESSAVSRTASDSRLESQLSSATSLTRRDSADLPQLTDPEVIHKVVKKITAMYGACNLNSSSDVVHMLGSIQATLKAYAAVERLWLLDQPNRVKHIYLCKCFPGTDAKMVQAALAASNYTIDQAVTVLERKGLTHVPSAFCLKDVFQGVQRMQGAEWVVVWDTCALMKDQWVGYQLLEEASVYQVIPFMTHLELNHIKDDKSDPEKAHKGQEGVKLVQAGLQPEYRGRFKLQPEYGEPPNAKDFLPPLTADRDSHIGDDLILQCAAFWDNRAQQLAKHMVFLTNDIALTNRALALGIQASQAPHWLKHSFS